MDPEQQPAAAPSLEFTEPRAELFTALAGAQAEFGELKRTATAKIQTKAGGSYEFSYAPLDELLDAVLPALGKHGLWLGQPVSGVDGGYQLRTIIAHKSGASMTSTMRLPRSEDVKALGSTITYLRRYSLQALLGLAAEEDDDGSAATGDKYERKAKGAKQAPKAPPPPVEKPVANDAPAPTEADFALVVQAIDAASDKQNLADIATVQKSRPWNDAQREEIRTRIAARQKAIKGAA